MTDMTLLVTFYSSSGVVFAADSAITIDRGTGAARVRKEEKILRARQVGLNGGWVGYFGLADVGQEPMHEWLRRKIDRWRGSQQVADLGDYLRDQLNNAVPRAHRTRYPSGLHIGAFETRAGSARTREGTVALAGIGHLYSMNPRWQVTGRSGAYKGLRGKQVFATDIPLDPNVPLATGRLFSISVITVSTNRRLHAGVVSRPTADTAFIRRANAACRASEAKGRRLTGFPFSSFDPFHPVPNLLPQVGRFFDQPARRRLPGRCSEHSRS